ncbi:acetyl-CoA carboxylase 1-like isoform X1 [Crassostrea virginica]
MQRLEKACIQIVEKLSSPRLNPDEKAEPQKKPAARQEKLLPMYHQVAIQIADLHDTPGRMEEMSFITAYLWEDDKAMVERLTEQIREDSIDNTVFDNIHCLQREHVLQVRSLIQDNPQVAMDSIVHITQHMTPSQRSEVSRILANMDT